MEDFYKRQLEATRYCNLKKEIRGIYKLCFWQQVAIAGWGLFAILLLLNIALMMGGNS